MFIVGQNCGRTIGELMNQVTRLKTSASLQWISIFTVWLFQISAIIGISLGYQDWFISKTPFTLLLTFTLLALNFPIYSKRKVLLTLFYFVSSFLLEWVGVHYGFLFGEYSYGSNLGLKLDAIPLLIGINWAVLVLVTGAIANRIVEPFFLRVMVAAALMVFLDYFIEVSAPPFDFWFWQLGYAPFQNFVAWFIVSMVFQFVYCKLKIQGNFVFSAHVYASQLVFFAYFYGYHRI
jgi:uncharacterized membrane protein